MTQRIEKMCPHCGWRYASVPGLVPDHAYSTMLAGGEHCPGSGQNPRNPESDRRPLWKDLPAERGPTEHEQRSTSVCRVCGEDTSVVVNINLKAVPVCDPCCAAITEQTVAWALSQREIKTV